jgi:hypothetical protein
MNLIISNHVQGSLEWHEDRLGKATGSKASIITSKGKTKGSESITRKNYKYQLALERITRVLGETPFTNKHLERGKELEKYARMFYELHYNFNSDYTVTEIGFCYPENKKYGCSVDGLINNEGIIEIKCPIPAIHYRYIEENTLPSDYFFQVMHNIYTTKRKYCDFISYNESMPEKLKLFIKRFEPSEQELKNYEEQLFVFLDEVDLLTNSIIEKCKENQ